MQLKSHIFIILFITVFKWSSSAILEEKPDFLQTCHRNTPEFNVCMTNALQNLYTKWRNGIPGYTDTTSIDPLLTKELNLIDDKNNVAPLVMKVKNIITTGISETIVKNVSFKDNEYSFKMVYNTPKLRMDADYTAQGKIMLFKLNSTGKFVLEIRNAYTTLYAKVKLRTDGVHKFFDIKSVRITIDSIENLHINLDNIFKDKELTKSLNDLMNDEWRAFYENSKPGVIKTIVAFQTRHLRRIFKSVPAEYFIADLINEN